MEQRRAELPTSKEIKGYVADFREFLQEGTVPERKALIRNFVQGIEIVEDEAVLTYTIPMPSDGVTSESASVLDFVQSGHRGGLEPPEVHIIYNTDIAASWRPRGPWGGHYSPRSSATWAGIMCTLDPTDGRHRRPGNGH